MKWIAYTEQKPMNAQYCLCKKTRGHNYVSLFFAIYWDCNRTWVDDFGRTHGEHAADFWMDAHTLDLEAMDTMLKEKKNEDDSEMDRFVILLSYDGETLKEFKGSASDRLDAIRLCRECLGSTDPERHGYVYVVDDSCGETVDGSQISF